MDVSCGQSEFTQYEGLTAVFPVRNNGEESSWRAIASTTREWIRKGYVKVVGFDRKSNRWLLNYIPSGLQKRIEEGEIIVDGRCEDGSLDINRIDSTPKDVAPKTVWNVKRHNATDYGISILNQIISARSFPYPKSLYSVYDILNFFVSNKKNALILDFFAGSGTTLHAVNLLNAVDGGNRRCILVTNNEVSDKETKELKKEGYKPGDIEWDNQGIARYVTWPRTVCSIKGIDINGKPIKGEYLENNISMKDGFKTNAIFFKLV